MLIVFSSWKKIKPRSETCWPTSLKECLFTDTGKEIEIDHVIINCFANWFDKPFGNFLYVIRVL